MAQAPKSRKPRLKAGGIGAQSSEPDLFAELQPATSLKSSATIPKLPPLPPGVTLQDLQCVICKELFHGPALLIHRKYISHNFVINFRSPCIAVQACDVLLVLRRPRFVSPCFT